MLTEDSTDDELLPEYEPNYLPVYKDLLQQREIYE
jgi:hypothetical protein